MGQRKLVAEESGKGTGLRILLIEDQRDIAANIWDFLEHRGFVMDHSVDGATGSA